MTLEQLRIFLAVVKHRHFTRAAEELYITQPAVSAAINTLEKEYGVKLFHRIGRHIEITEAGKFLELEAQKILDQVILTERGLRELNNLKRGEVRLGSSLTIGNYWLPNWISQFKQKHPGIAVTCTLGNAEEIGEGTVSGRFDLGLVTGSVKASLQSTLKQDEVGSDRIQIVVGRSHPWYKRGTIVVDELRETSWVMRESGSGVQQVFEDMLRHLGIEPSKLQVELILNSSEMVKSVVEGGLGAAAVSELMLQKELKLGTLRAIKVLHLPAERGNRVLDIIQPVLMVWHRERFQSRAAIAFQELLLRDNHQRRGEPDTSAAC
ncbi:MULTISPECIES: LysR family transcriptional regulator [unclassified Leptolyngbya]|uniref:LysR family transcriptional regulator n=1 Tax=unclassified Leptolyngbya TaxID=2650499 RepID=UPI001688FACB|nr:MULTISPECIES: LysR family transcriptional regulator [unclassified Leptolyngbya]MBD1909895.1 LysR family transcriptional regulator [Leptolyngbya sp. FACHB-8]MBD2158641.1 LysR family transcriptional regulator [Leptolyngbya sp. FACHB-16]